MNFRLIAEEKPHHPVSRLARVLGVSRAGFYAWQKRPPSQRARSDAALSVHIRAIHAGTDGIYGAPRVHAELADEHSLHVGRKRVARLMRAAGLEERSAVVSSERPERPKSARNASVKNIAANPSTKPAA